MLKRGRIISAILFLVGASIILYEPIMGRYIFPNYLNKQYEIYSEIDHKRLKFNEERLKKLNSELFDFEDVGSLSYAEAIKTSLKEESLVGSIYIPSVDIKMPILYGSTHENMLIGAGTLKPNQIMGEGNYAIGSHNSKNPNGLFAPISRMKSGDLIYLTDKEYIYIYEMNYREIVEPTKIEVIQDNLGIKEVTLLSCFSSDGSDRIVVKGKFLEKKLGSKVEANLLEKLLFLK